MLVGENKQLILVLYYLLYDVSYLFSDCMHNVENENKPSINITEGNVPSTQASINIHKILKYTTIRANHHTHSLVKKIPHTGDKASLDQCG